MTELRKQALWSLLSITGRHGRKLQSRVEFFESWATEIMRITEWRFGEKRLIDEQFKVGETENKLGRDQLRLE